MVFRELSCTWFLVELVFGNVGFWGEGKTGVPGEKPLGANDRAKNKLCTRMKSTPGFAEPRPDWWEASPLTTAPSLTPHFWHKIAKFAKFSTEQVCQRKFFTLERFPVNTIDTCARRENLNQNRPICGFWSFFFCHSFQMIYFTSCAIVLHQERIKGTEKASPIHTLFHR